MDIHEIFSFENYNCTSQELYGTTVCLLDAIAERAEIAGYVAFPMYLHAARRMLDQGPWEVVPTGAESALEGSPPRWQTWQTINDKLDELLARLFLLYETPKDDRGVAAVTAAALCTADAILHMHDSSLGPVDQVRL